MSPLGPSTWTHFPLHPSGRVGARPRLDSAPQPPVSAPAGARLLPCTCGPASSGRAPHRLGRTAGPEPRSSRAASPRAPQTPPHEPGPADDAPASHPAFPGSGEGRERSPRPGACWAARAARPLPGSGEPPVSASPRRAPCESAGSSKPTRGSRSTAAEARPKRPQRPHPGSG